jgi:predicted anti-sigma-YlaC factor YlaD
MRSDHEVFQRRIDEALVARTTIPEERSLREHLQSCVQCQEYLNANTRVIAGLSGFSFELDPALNAKVLESITQRARQLETAPFNRRRWALVCTLALTLTVVGSFLDLQFGSLIASHFDIQLHQVRQGLFAFWIVPSICLLLLFPMLPLLTAANRNERTL